MKLATDCGASFSNSSITMSPLVVVSFTRGRSSALASAARIFCSASQSLAMRGEMLQVALAVDQQLERSAVRSPVGSGTLANKPAASAFLR